MAVQPDEGYIYNSYGKEKYLGHVIASIATLRRYDQVRPVSIVCDQGHADLIKQRGFSEVFDQVIVVGPEHCSIVGFKHHIDQFSIYPRTLMLDSDMVWCKHPDRLWKSLSGYDFTITGVQNADVFFGAPKGIGILKVILLGLRSKTLKKYGLTYLPRVQSGVIYTSNRDIAQRVCEKARYYLSNISETHFQSRLNEAGRGMESCEWSLAMAMSHYDTPVYPWMIGHESAQLDFIESFTKYDEEFLDVQCTYYTDPKVHALRGIKQDGLRQLLIWWMARGRSADVMKVTPYLLHFGWLHQKEPFHRFADRTYEAFCSGAVSIDQIVVK